MIFTLQGLKRSSAIECKPFQIWQIMGLPLNLLSTASVGVHVSHPGPLTRIRPIHGAQEVAQVQAMKMMLGGFWTCNEK